MKSSRVPLLLFLTILTSAILPLVAALYLFDETLETSLNLGFNDQVLGTLNKTSENLKALKDLDPSNESQYRRQFDDVAKLQFIYSQPELVKVRLLESLKLYFICGVVIALLASLAVASLLGRRIAKTYRSTFEALAEQREKVRYLEEVSSWQELAKMLAHEIKNPLTPIEILITSLGKSFQLKSPEEFSEHLKKTEIMIHEEIGHLKNIVNKFGDFAQVPEIKLSTENISEAIGRNVNLLTTSFASSHIDFYNDETANELSVKLDPTLFRQVLFNIVKNGIEANPSRTTRFTIRIISTSAHVVVQISNDGLAIPEKISTRIFDPYVSSKNGKDNMGLGLVIVRKIMIEHGGEVSFANVNGMPTFSLTLQRETT